MNLKELNEWLNKPGSTQSDYGFEALSDGSKYYLKGLKMDIGTADNCEAIKSFVLGACWERNR